jgi:hypothetical protein
LDAAPPLGDLEAKKGENTMSSSSVSKGAISLLVVSLAMITAFAQYRRGSMQAPRYDPATETTIKGVVDELTRMRGQMGWGGTHLTLKTDSETINVHVGPSDFIAKQGFTFAIGDRIEVTGSKVKYNDSDALIAREIKKDGKVLTLRDTNGIPAWSRRKPN